MCKTILAALAAALLANVAGFAAEPSSSAGGAQAAPSIAAPGVPACGQALAGMPAPGGLPALALQSSPARASELAGPACTLATANHGVELGAKPFHGFCRCSCTFTPDCNTSADCGGAPCIHAITCC
jgi:hypothetical protein